MIVIYYDSRQLLYKKPFGAVREDESVHLHLEIEKEIAVEKVHFVIAPDGGDEMIYEMQPEVDGSRQSYVVSFSLPEKNLYFYRFEVVRKNGEYLFVGRGDDGHAVVGDWLPRWSLTVYDKSFEELNKYVGGVMYQIFPDRFARTSDTVPQVEIKSMRWFHENTSDKPFGFADPNQPGGRDFFGGSIEGVRQKLGYLKDLGVTILYFNPVFESAENHRYSTSDYKKVDPYFGTNEELEAFCEEAKKMGISVLLDGVFSHTGADSVYFNREGHYDSVGAYNSPDSPYYSWYDFKEYPDRYAGWWGFESLPNTKETDPSYLEFITGEDGVLEFWQKKGVSGWRLDVADELPDAFLEALRRRVKQTDPEALIIGEVWEHAVYKISYGARRKFLLGEQCDTVMNYPWREAIIQLIRTKNVSAFAQSVETLCEDYPSPSLNTLMNILSTHDTARILTVLGCDVLVPIMAQSDYKLPEENYHHAVQALKTAALLQFTLPGNPCIYYGDEIGMQGFGDPWCRRFFSWDNICKELHDFYMALGKLRHDFKKDFSAELHMLKKSDGIVCYSRGAHIGVLANFSEGEIEIPGTVLLSTSDLDRLPPQGAAVYCLNNL